MFNINFDLGDSKVGPSRGVAVNSPYTVHNCMVILTYLILNESLHLARMVNQI